MKRTLFLFVGLFTLFSCAVDDVDTASRDDSTNFTTDSNQYSISEEEALANLYAFMGEGGDSRSSDNRVVNSVVPIKYNSLGTRAVEGVDCDNLLYIANFENEEGYAILAGDTRIDDEVIAITDRGSLESEVLNNIIVEWEDGERPHFEGYPTTGPGFYTTPETGDQLIMNPNTVDLFIEEEQDTLVGNYNYDIDSISTRTISDNMELSNHNSDGFALSLCATYAMRGLIEFEPRPRDDNEENTGTWTEVVTTPWSVTESVNPLLYQFRYWHQGTPFNDLYPNLLHPILPLIYRRASAGCFPLSIAKILTFFQYPTTLTINGHTINWEALTQSYLSDDGSDSAAILLKFISNNCDSWLFYGGTFTFPYKAKAFMRSLGFSNVQKSQYSFEIVKTMLNNGNPLIISSIPRWHILKSHAWNIDGYKIKQRTKTIKYYVDDVLNTTTTSTETKKMVHCDFGWSGNCNGYYSSGVFDLNDPNIEYDSDARAPKNLDYSWYVRLIHYSL